MAVEAHGNDLVRVVALLAAAVVAVPLFKRLGLGSVLGYLAAGLAIGPFGLGLFTDPQAILHVAELGVVMFLFVIGLEMQPSRLWGLRREIFGLGLVQVAVCGALLTSVGLLAGLRAPVAFIAAMGFVMTSTATVMLLLDERGETSTPRGQRIVSVLLLEDLAIVPLLALVALLGSASADVGTRGSAWLGVGLALVAIAALFGAGRWLLNPMFRLLAAARAREVMTAAALLVVLGSALLMQWGGLSMVVIFTAMCLGGCAGSTSCGTTDHLTDFAVLGTLPAEEGEEPVVKEPDEEEPAPSATLALVAGGLWLERCCRAPDHSRPRATE